MELTRLTFYAEMPPLGGVSGIQSLTQPLLPSARNSVKQDRGGLFFWV